MVRLQEMSIARQGMVAGESFPVANVSRESYIGPLKLQPPGLLTRMDTVTRN